MNPVEEGVAEVLLAAQVIQARVRQLGAAISEDYQGLDPVLVGVLKGVIPFIADLARAITVPIAVDFMAISKFEPGAREGRGVRILKDLDQSISGRHVIFVEDVIDTGLTLNYLLRILRARGPASLKVCALFDRSACRLADIEIDYKGFDVPDLFLIGYGLDYAQRYRNLPYVGVLEPEIELPW